MSPNTAVRRSWFVVRRFDDCSCSVMANHRRRPCGTTNDERRTTNQSIVRGLQSAIALALASVLAAAEPAWDWLPRAADDDRRCELHLAAPDTWSAVPVDGLIATREDGQLVLLFEPQRVAAVSVNGPQNRRLTVELVSPGKGAGLTCDEHGQLLRAGSAAILAVPRREAAADRRWGMLRAFDQRKAEPCTVFLAEPPASALGPPVLGRQVAAAQALDPRGSGVLVHLSGDDRFAAWKHREYRQALAWLVADLAARGASHVVLVEPACPLVDEPLLAPLRAQVRDVARAYRCAAVDTTALGGHDGWEASPGVLGRTLNATGIARRVRLLADWLAVSGN